MLGTIISGLGVALKTIDFVSNNIANAKSNGFKTSSGSFKDVYPFENAENIRTMGRGATSASKVLTNQKQGSIMETGNALDVAIQGVGYFVLLPASGVPLKFTRDGSFSLSAAGELKTIDGDFVMTPQLKKIVVPMEDINGNALTNVQVMPDGRVLAEYGLQPKIELARIAMANFKNPGRLTADGAGKFMENSASGTAEIAPPTSDGLGNLVGGALELSNTDITSELTTMLKAQQAFSANSKMLQTEGEIIKKFLS
tara:strand:+ start:1121 stop:1888 length:768 start_codon:yes stop_codon:yes gene_type:complete